MVAQVANDALIAVRVLSEYVLDNNDDLFNDILRSHLRADQLL